MSDFKKRMWLAKVKILQIDSMDEDLRRELWNMIYPKISDWLNTPFWSGEKTAELARFIAKRYLKQTDSSFERENFNIIEWRLNSFIEKLEQFLFNWDYADICELIEDLFWDTSQEKTLNMIFENENFWFRFKWWKLEALTNTIEIAEVDNAINIKAWWNHFKKAVGFLSDKKQKNYDKVIEESIKWIESLLRELLGDHSLTLGEAIKKIKNDWSKKEYSALWEWLNKLWWFASENIRHASKPDWIEVDFTLAKFILVLASSLANFINSIR